MGEIDEGLVLDAVLGVQAVLVVLLLPLLDRENAVGVKSKFLQDVKRSMK
jgi:hypothetical protein